MMLKLERVSKGHDLAITLREKDPFFNSLFLKALAIALAFHLSGMILFQIHPFRMSSSFLYPPVKVHTDPAISLETMSLPLQEADNPLFNTPYTVIPDKTLAWAPAPLPSSSPFTTIEQNPYKPQLMIKRKKISYFISGPLAERAATPLFSQEISVPANADPLYLKYHVQVDPREGKIFWYEPLQKGVHHDAEKALLNMKFSTDNTLDNLSGTIDFVVYHD